MILGIPAAWPTLNPASSRFHKNFLVGVELSMGVLLLVSVDDDTANVDLHMEARFKLNPLPPV